MMARTLNGRMTGRAGAAELADQRAEIFEAQMKRDDELKKDYGDLVDALKWLDPQGWEAWYDEHVPAWQGIRNSEPAMIVIRARVDELVKMATGGLSNDELDAFHALVVSDGSVSGRHFFSLLDERRAEAMAGCN